MAEDYRLLTRIKLTNLLSFGPDSPPLELENLNVLIGPNASGKSNLLEAISLLRATPVSGAVSNSNLSGVIRQGGGPGEWVWKIKKGVASIEVVVNLGQGLLHRFAFADKQHFELHSERIEYLARDEGEFYYRYQREKPVLRNSDAEQERELPWKGFDRDLSILAQLRDPEQYMEISYLADVYTGIRIYREWAFGRNTVFREPQRTDMRNDRLEEDFSNLGLVLSRLRKTPKAKAAILEGLNDLYDGFTDFDTYVEGGTIQVFFTEGDITIPATRLSDGTLRYLCLLSILCDPNPPPLICIEEPELGLHPDILPKLADLLVQASERTQLIVTTHSDVVVDALTEHPEAVVVVEKHEGSSTMRRLKKQDLQVWLEKYRLGQLWMKGKIGGTRW